MCGPQLPLPCVQCIRVEGSALSVEIGCVEEWAGNSDPPWVSGGQGDSPGTQGTLFHPLHFCGWCSCGGCRINSPLGEGRAGTVEGKPPKRHSRSAGSVDRFSALKADGMITGPSLKVWRQSEERATILGLI